MLKLEMLSANLAIGMASVFVLVTAGVSLVVDKEAATARPPSEAWKLRGSLSSADPRGPRSGVERTVRMSARL